MAKSKNKRKSDKNKSDVRARRIKRKKIQKQRFYAARRKFKQKQEELLKELGIDLETHEDIVNKINN